ncbi:MAG: beta-propeller fold lactonase family protein [Nocardioides sp.]
MTTRRDQFGIGIATLGVLATAGLATGAVGVSGAAAAPGAPRADAAHQVAAARPQLASSAGAAFAMTNATKKNEIVRYRRDADGTLARVGTTSTHGLGIGVDLDTQGPLRLSQDHKYLYAVNAGSDDLSVFRVQGTKLTFEQKIYAGDEPTSLTIHEDRLYVLDGSVASNSIRGFKRGSNGKLRPLKGSIQLLSSPIAVPGDIEFSPDGRLILVTEKTTANTLTPAIALDAFAIDGNGVAGPAQRDESAGIRPFSLAFNGNDQVLVAESFDAAEGKSAVSSYTVDGLELAVNSGSVGNNQTDTCWIVVTNDGRYAYTANFGSGTISSYQIAGDGQVILQQGAAATLPTGSQPVDLAQTDDSGYLYLLLRGAGAVAQFKIGPTGALTHLGTENGGLPVADGASGLAVY